MDSTNQAEGVAPDAGSVIGRDTYDPTVDVVNNTETDSSTLDSTRSTEILDPMVQLAEHSSDWRSENVAASVSNISPNINIGTTMHFTNYGNHYDHTNFGNMFGTLFPPVLAVSRTEELRARAMIRTRQQKNRLKQQESDVILCVSHVPYAVVADSAIENMLLRVTNTLHFLDSGFAEYFTHVVDGDPAYVRSELRDIRLRLAKAQKPNGPDSPPDSNLDVNLGDLGHFCEEVLQAHEAALPFKAPNGPEFRVTRGDISDTLSYLQDALEAPYWKYMLKELGQWRVNSTGLTGRAVLSVIYSAKLGLQVAVAKIKHEGETKGLSDNIAPIIKGIEQRITLLEGIRDSNLDGLDDVDVILRENRYLPGYHVKKVPSTNPSAVNDVTPGVTGPRITVASMVAVLVCLAFAVPFLAMGFSKAQNKGEVGSTQDADFWFLLKDNIMSTLGSVLMVIALKRGPLFSMVYLHVYLMLGAGLIFSIVSVFLFSCAHSGWSNMVGMIGTMASTWAVLIMTQADEQGGAGGQKAQKAEKAKAE